MQFYDINTSFLMYVEENKKTYFHKAGIKPILVGETENMSGLVMTQYTVIMII